MTTHRHHPLTDDATIDGADLLAEVRAQLGYGVAPVAPAPPPPTPATPVDEDLTIDGFEFLQQIQYGATVDPLALGPTVAATPAARWAPPSPAVSATPVGARPGRWQLAVVIGAFLVGVTVTALTMTLLGWGLGT